MDDRKLENIVGAATLALSDGLVRAARSHAPESASAAAITLVGHLPGLTIEQLRHAMGLSHPGAVRLVDRLERDGLVIRGGSEIDRRAVSLTLTEGGRTACDNILAARQNALRSALASLNRADRQSLGRIAEKILRATVHSEEQALETCRLCDPAVCIDCPVVAELNAREALEG